MTHQATRRSALGLLAASVAIGGTPGAIKAAHGATLIATDRSAWDTALERFTLADSAHMSALNVLHRAEIAHALIAPPQPASGILVYNGQRSFTLQEAWSNAKAERERYEAADAECRLRFNLDALDEASSDACHAAGDALDDLLVTPACDLLAVARKIELAIEYGREVNELEPVLADLTRLAGGQA